MTEWADEAMGETHLADACEPIEDYESEEGIKRYFAALRAGWSVGRDGRLRPPDLNRPAPPAPPQAPSDEGSQT